MARFVANTVAGVQIGVGGSAYGGGGVIAAYDASRIAVAYPVVQPNVVETYSGAGLTYGPSPDGAQFMLLGGSLAGYAQTYGETVLVSGSDFHLPAPPGVPVSATGLVTYLMSGDDSILGSPWGDEIRGLDGNDTIDGGVGWDDVNGNKGSDLVLGGDGADTVRGGQGDDTVMGGAGSDAHVNGNIGADLVYGGDGDDTVYGGQDRDTVHGDAGADLLSGDLGDDVLFGGAGADRFAFRPGSGLDWIGDFSAAEGDRVQLPTGTGYFVVSYEGQALITLSTGDAIGLAGVPIEQFRTDWVVFA